MCVRAAAFHAHVGSSITLAAILSSTPGQSAHGLPHFREKVVGIFLTRDNPVPINQSAQLPVVYATHAFYEQLGPPIEASTGPTCALGPVCRRCNSVGRPRPWPRSSRLREETSSSPI